MRAERIVARGSRFAHRALFAAAQLLVVLLSGRDAAAHLGQLSYSDVVIHGAEIDYRLRFATHLIPGFGADAAGRLTHRDVVAHEAEITAWVRDTIAVELAGGACTPELIDTTGPDANDDLVVVMRYSCPKAGDALRIEFHAFDETLPDFQNIVSVQHAGAASAFVFTPTSRVFMLGDARAATGRGTNFRRFFVLGVGRIWTGYGPLLCLLALLLPGGTLARLAGIAAAFTIAHSITLALAVLGVVTLPGGLVEAASAASVMLAALDALRLRAHDRQWLAAFAYGLIHGFGFAAILREGGLPASAVAVPLLGFNMGIVAGQVVVVALAVPLIRAAAEWPAGRRLLRTIALGIAAVGAFWLATCV